MTGHAALPPFPPVIEVELTRRCNLSCRMCQRQAVRAQGDGLDLQADVLAAVLDGCRGGGPLQINLGGLGESLLHPGLPDLFAQIKAHDPRIRTGFNTNGLALADGVPGWLLDGRVDYLSISLNAPDAEGYRWLVGRDVHDRVVRGARAFLVRKGRGNPPLSTVHVFRLPAFAAATPAFRREWGALADFVQERDIGNWGGTIDRAAFTPEALELGVCDRPWLSVAVGLDGGYHRCCATFALEPPASWVQDMPVGDYWLGAEMERRRAAMLAGAFGAGDPCAACSGRAIRANTAIEHAAYGRMEQEGERSWT